MGEGRMYSVGEEGFEGVGYCVEVLQQVCVCSVGVLEFQLFYFFRLWCEVVYCGVVGWGLDFVGDGVVLFFVVDGDYQFDIVFCQCCCIFVICLLLCQISGLGMKGRGVFGRLVFLMCLIQSFGMILLVFQIFFFLDFDFDVEFLLDDSLWLFGWDS